MFHQASTEWPCLSVDFLANLQDCNNYTPFDFRNPVPFKYPLDLFVIGGS